MRIPMLMIIGLMCAATVSAADFSSAPLSVTLQKDLLQRDLWEPSCPVPLQRLQLLTLSYYDFFGRSHQDGQMIVLDAVAEPVLTVFRELYRRKFPIDKIRPTSAYDGDDARSMADNNTSAYNCRQSTRETLPSLHAYGVAVDVNTVQNPYVGPTDKQHGAAEVLPPQGLDYLNRTNRRPGMAEDVVALFRQHGFPVWGGSWNDPIDWQHFSPSRTVAQLLATMEPEHAKELFALYAKDSTLLTRTAYNQEGLALAKQYRHNPEQFMAIFRSHQDRLNRFDPPAAVKFLEQQLAERGK